MQAREGKEVVEGKKGVGAGGIQYIGAGQNKVGVWWGHHHQVCTALQAGRPLLPSLPPPPEGSSSSLPSPCSNTTGMGRPRQGAWGRAVSRGVGQAGK